MVAGLVDEMVEMMVALMAVHWVEKSVVRLVDESLGVMV